MNVKKTLTTLSFISIIALFSCKKEPVACMELSSENVAVGQEVTFTTCSEKALSYDWYFTGPVGAPENDTAFSDITFSLAFSMPGTYTVTHVAFEKFSFLGESDTTTKVITVN